MPKKKTQAPALTDEDYLQQAMGPDGCHANTEEALAACERLSAQGLVSKGPYKNLIDRPVYFADQPLGALADDDRTTDHHHEEHNESDS